jgi:hypothetical protein
MTKTKTKTYTPRDPAPLARAVVLWIRISLGLTVVGLITGLMQVVALARISPARSFTFGAPIRGLEPFAPVIGVADAVSAVVGIVAMVLFLKWIYRTSRNAHALSAQPLKISPPWAVGWFFVPIANLFKPLEAVRETWQATLRPDAPNEVKPPPIVWNWWKFWVVSNLFAIIGVRASMQADEVGEALIGSVITAAALAVSIAQCLIEVKLVRQLTELQVEKLSEKTFS